MNRYLIGIALAAGLASSAVAADRVDARVDVRGEASTADYQEVRSISLLTRLHGFSVVDNDRLIVWRTPFDPYLVELRHPVPGLRFAWNIGFTSSLSRIDARFDDVRVDGFRYRIERIYRLDREAARTLIRTS